MTAYYDYPVISIAYCQRQTDILYDFEWVTPFLSTLVFAYIIPGSESQRFLFFPIPFVLKCDFSVAMMDWFFIISLLLVFLFSPCYYKSSMLALLFSYWERWSKWQWSVSSSKQENGAPVQLASQSSLQEGHPYCQKKNQIGEKLLKNQNQRAYVIVHEERYLSLLLILQNFGNYQCKLEQYYQLLTISRSKIIFFKEYETVSAHLPLCSSHHTHDL